MIFSSMKTDITKENNSGRLHRTIMFMTKYYKYSYISLLRENSYKLFFIFFKYVIYII